MISAKEAIDALINSYNVVEFVHVGFDSYFSELVVEASHRGLTKKFDDGADAVAYTVGRQLVDPDHRVCILMDSLEISRASSKIISLSEVYQIPLLMIIGNHPPSSEEPQYRVMGEISKEMIMMTMMETGGIVVDLNDDDHLFQLPIAPIEKNDSLIYMVNYKNLFCSENWTCSESSATLEARDVIDMLSRLRKIKEFILVSSPMNSSYLYGTDNSLNFYDIGSSGSTLALAQGLAVQNRYPVISLEDNIIKTISREVTSDKKCLRIILTTHPSSEAIKTKEELVGLENLLKSDTLWSGDDIEIGIVGCNNYVDWSSYNPEQRKVDLARSLGYDMSDPEGPVDYYIESMESINAPDPEPVKVNLFNQCPKCSYHYPDCGCELTSEEKKRLEFNP